MIADARQRGKALGSNLYKSQEANIHTIPLVAGIGPTSTRLGQLPRTAEQASH